MIIYLEKQEACRKVHLHLVSWAGGNGTLIMAGALADPADGAILIFKGESKKVAEDFATNDPYVINGLISEWTISPCTVVVGGTDLFRCSVES